MFFMSFRVLLNDFNWIVIITPFYLNKKGKRENCYALIEYKYRKHNFTKKAALFRGGLFK